jgi:hypothetical protein
MGFAESLVIEKLAIKGELQPERRESHDGVVVGNHIIYYSGQVLTSPAPHAAHAHHRTRTAAHTRHATYTTNVDAHGLSIAAPPTRERGRTVPCGGATARPRHRNLQHRRPHLAPPTHQRCGPGPPPVVRHHCILMDVVCVCVCGVCRVIAGGPVGLNWHKLSFVGNKLQVWFGATEDPLPSKRSVGIISLVRPAPKPPPLCSARSVQGPSELTVISQSVATRSQTPEFGQQEGGGGDKEGKGKCSLQ